MRRFLFAAILGPLLWISAGWAEPLRLAVASNFAAPMRELVSVFEQNHPYTVVVSFASSGKLYAQIRQGAPFDLFFSADQEKAYRLVNEDRAYPHHRFSYAEGRLALWSADKDFIDGSEAILRSGNFNHLAIANPKFAPFGVAAMQVLASMALVEQVSPRLVRGENIGQAYHFIASGNAQLGFVAQSQVMRDGKLIRGSAWIVPPDLHQPIMQDALVLKPSADKPAAQAFFDFLHSARADAIIQRFGYAIPLKN